MNNRTTIFIIFLIFMVSGSFAQVPAQNKGYLHLNKAYFSTEENIHFKAYFNPILKEEKVMSILLYRMIESKPNSLYLRYRKKVQATNNADDIKIPPSLPTSEYLLTMFIEQKSESIQPIYNTNIFIHNPSIPQEEVDLKNTSSKSVSDGYVINELTSIKIKTSLSSTNITPGDRVELSGSLINKSGKPIEGNISVSVVLSKFMPDQHEQITLTSLSPEQSIKIRNNGFTPGYISGKIYGNGSPLNLASVFMYIKDPDISFERYFSGSDGAFYFQEKEIADDYQAMFLTYPDQDIMHSFEINLPILDKSKSSFLLLNGLKYSQEYTELSERLHQIRQSYFNSGIEEDKLSENTQSQDFLGEPFHLIIPDEYIEFSTLPEVIREIVPQTTIRFSNGKYTMRIYDARAKDYCCKGNPIIFINDEPYLDISPVMDLGPSDIEFIEVHKALESIGFLGEAGKNGILYIKLKKGVEHQLSIGQSKQTMQLNGLRKQYSKPLTDPPEGAPDFREWLYWNDDIHSDMESGFKDSFKTSLLEGEYTILIVGQIESGEIIYETMDFYNGE